MASLAADELSYASGAMEWVFGYGSLLPRVWSGPAAPNPEPGSSAIPCQLHGWRRVWGVAMDNSVDLPDYKHYELPDGSRPALYVAFLDLLPAEGAATNGVAVPVAPDELPGLDRRERNYCRHDVTGQIDPSLEGRVWTYVGSEEARDRAATGARSDRLVVARSYLERVLDGFDSIGQRELFSSTTAPGPSVVDLSVVSHAPQERPRAFNQ